MSLRNRDVLVGMSGVVNVSGQMKEQRQCDGCSACCEVLRIDVLDKPTYQKCEHVCDGGGCGVYGSRPVACQSFRCLWLLGHLDEGQRPDKLGVMLTVTEHPLTGKAIMFTEVHDEAMVRPEVVAAMREAVARLPIAIMRKGENVLVRNEQELDDLLGMQSACA
ncbi:hypothetical protein [Poriferisphaera sp. WC338]|uniref:hypothetical protein n=1 Tax=Poriferisphaera sp. WC338 TaxID=3425129 RepID=UPI003D81465B